MDLLRLSTTLDSKGDRHTLTVEATLCKFGDGVNEFVPWVVLGFSVQALEQNPLNRPSGALWQGIVYARFGPHPSWS